MADDALTDDDREALRGVFAGWSTMPNDLAPVVERIARRARAEGARDALNAAADAYQELAADPFVGDGEGMARWAAYWLRGQADKHHERAAQHEEQP